MACQTFVIILQRQLYRHQVMQFQITDIEFDFDDEDELDDDYKSDLFDDTLATVWEAVDEDDLVEEITAATGWCIKSIDYRHILR
jgi:hypothetical protein